MRIRVALLVLAISSLATAVTTTSWTHRSADDFGAGDMQDVVVGSHGDLRLSRSTSVLVKDDARLDVIHSLVQAPDGSAYIGTGLDGTIVRRSAAGELVSLYQAGAESLVTSMHRLPDGRLLAGISGAAARLVQVDTKSGEAKELWSDNEIRFVWAITAMPNGNILVATGPTGKLLEISPAGNARVVFTAKQSNLMRMVPAGAGEVIVGTEPEAMVLRVSVQSGEWFVLYDAPESEISAVVRDEQGNLYVAATASSAAGITPAPPAGGRPQIAPEVPLHREPPSAPQPPALPDPNPGEPAPIPKAVPAPRLRVLDAEPAGEGRPQTQPASTPSPVSPAATDAGEEDASSTAIYRITPAGFVTEVLRRPGSAYAMLLSGNALLLGTGPEGEVVEYRPDTEESATLWRSGSRHVSAMALQRDGNVLLGLSNPGALVRMGGRFATKGTYTSVPLDASQVARFGKVELHGTVPAQTAVTLSTRSGNTADPEQGGWSKWSEETPAAEFIQITSPASRFLQYRITLTSQDAASTPTVEHVKLNYIVPNLAPKVASVVVEPAGEEEESTKTAPPPAHTIRWEASDPNDDRMVYALDYRLGHQGQWVRLKDKLTEPQYKWDTRQVADGRYQIRVIASDDRANASGEGKTGQRFSDPVTIDNTPPAIGDVKTAQTADGAEIRLRVVDRTGTVTRVEYAVDAADDWQAALASDMLYDSPDETVTFAVAKLAPGQHQVTVRAADATGNTAYETLIITVPNR